MRILFLLTVGGLFTGMTGCITYTSHRVSGLSSARHSAFNNSDSLFEVRKTAPGRLSSEPDFSGSFASHHSRLFRHLRLTYGAFSYLGNVPQPGAQTPLPNSYSSGINTGLGYVISTPDMDWTIVGTEIYLQPSLSAQSLSGAPEQQSFRSTTQVTAGLGSELFFKNSRHPFGMKLFAGKPFGNSHDLQNYLVLPTVVNARAYSRHKNITAFAQLQLSPKIHFTLGLSYSLRKKFRNPGLYRER